MGKRANRQWHTTNAICWFSFEKFETFTCLFTKFKKCWHVKCDSLQWAGGLQFANSCRHVSLRIVNKTAYEKSPEYESLFVLIFSKAPSKLNSSKIYHVCQGLHSQKYCYQNFVCMFFWLTQFFNHNLKKIKATLKYSLSCVKTGSCALDCGSCM